MCLIPKEKCAFLDILSVGCNNEKKKEDIYEAFMSVCSDYIFHTALKYFLLEFTLK